MIVRIFAISALALCAGSFVEKARSAQLFVCGDGKAVEIEAGQLDAAKRTNPCVARHFGLKVKTDGQPTAGSSLRPAIAAPGTTDANRVELPIRNPKTAAFRNTMPSHHKTQKRAAKNQIAKAKAVNFRKVRIINAAPGSVKWFNHKR